MKVRECMTQGVQTVRPHDDLHQAALRMWKHDCGALPVVDRDDRVVGMITDRDVCMAAFTQGRPLKQLRVSVAMSERAISCAPDDSVSVAEAMMRTNRVRRLPVLDDEGRLVGILSLNDLALEAARERSAGRHEVELDEVGGTLAEICRHRNGKLSVVVG